MADSMIETLEFANRDEVVEVVGTAFRDQGLLPSDTTGRRSRRLVAALLKTFDTAPDARLFGVRREGRLDCAAFVYDAGFEPRGFALALFLFRLVRAVGWTMSRAFGDVLSQKPERDERQLELMLLGTRTDCQGQGLGRAVIRHIFDFARRRGYQSVVLEVAKETPAYGFYLREGFEVEQEVTLVDTPLCFVRREVGGTDV
jgi:ribosomal protein S18 acetylase RimI-like enzyme